MENTPNPKCSRCKCYWKPDENDVKSSGLVCKTCKKCRENGNKYYEKNADKVKVNMKKYYEENADKYKKYREKYNENNPDKVKENIKKYREKNKCEHNKEHGRCKICDKYLYLINLQRVHIYNCLKNSNLEKTKPSISYLDCSAEYFVEYFEKKMNLWNEYHDVKMNWDNIHTDHIKPVNAFDLDDEEEFLKCCHYTNMQPLLADDNLYKSCKWTDQDDMHWNNNIIYKEYFDAYIPV
jgi:hypothetical protein